MEKTKKVVKQEIDCYIYAKGLVHSSVCVPKGYSHSEIEQEVNRIYPSGVTPWKISDDTHFADGIKTNPCQCEDNVGREHYLLSC